MSIEEQLKALILSRCKSVKSFAEAAGVPNSTVDTMLKKSVLKAEIGNVIKICKFLGISADGLGEGKIVAREQIELTPAEVELIKSYRKLDVVSQRVVETVVQAELQRNQPLAEESQNANSAG